MFASTNPLEHLLLASLFSHLIHPAKANFHISHADVSDPLGASRNTDQACPSNYYTCQCMADPSHNRGAPVFSGSPATNDFFALRPGLCGMGQLNFYKQGEPLHFPGDVCCTQRRREIGTYWLMIVCRGEGDGRWLFFVNAGNGEVQGECYRNDVVWTTNCNGAAVRVSDYLVCYSYICE